MSAVEVPAEAILAFLKQHGFVERDAMKVRGNEIVFERHHKIDTRYKVLVYTSVRRGAQRARSVGKDAIRVCAIYEHGSDSRGILKLPRVHRTGTVEGVLARMLDRMREAYDACCRARPKRDRARCPSPIDAATLPPAMQASIDAALDAVQQKHHPGSMPYGHEHEFGEHFPEDDLDGDEP